MGIRGRLILLVAGVVMAMITIGLIDLYRVWQFNHQQLTNSLKKRTELAAVAFEQWANSQQEPLATLAEIIEDKPIRSIIIGSNLAYLLETRPSWINLEIVDRDGNNLASLTKGREPPKSLIDDLLKKINEKKQWVLTTDRTEDEDRPIFTIATPIRDGGAVIAQIDGESVKELFSDVELAEKTVVSIFNKEGKVLYRRISRDVTFSSEIVGTPLIKSLGKERIAVAEIESPYDGIRRVYGMARSMRSEDVVLIGISSERFYDPLWDQIYHQLQVSFLIFLIAIGLTLLLAYSILRSLDDLKEATQLFASGDSKARAPENVSGEIGELGKAFNRMAEQITEREARLKELDRLKTEFVSSVSHELKTPLTTIKTLAHVLNENTVSDDERTEYLNVIGTECDRQILLVANILDVSQIESGKYKFESSEIDLRQILEDVCQLEKPTARLKGNDLQLIQVDGLPTVKANREALLRIFRSLVENAIKYTPETGIITISAQASAKEVAVSITDSGCGILTQDVPHIFEKFFRGRPQSDVHEQANQSGGVGLGLFLTKKIVEQLDGRIEVAENPAGGTICTVYMPIYHE